MAEKTPEADQERTEEAYCEWDRRLKAPRLPWSHANENACTWLSPPRLKEAIPCTNATVRCDKRKHCMRAESRDQVYCCRLTADGACALVQTAPISTCAQRGVRGVIALAAQPASPGASDQHRTGRSCAMQVVLAVSVAAVPWSPQSARSNRIIGLLQHFDARVDAPCLPATAQCGTPRKWGAVVPGSRVQRASPN
jgi:hypothetical protein